MFLCFTTQCQVCDSREPGFRARMIYASLKAGKMNEKIFDRLLKKPPRGTKALSPKKFHRKLDVEESNVDGFRLLTIRSKEATYQHIILLHGGAYIAEANRGHRTLMEKLALQHHFTVSFIDYPLAPEYDMKKCHEVVQKAFNLLTNTFKKDTFYLIGDSAGGGLALAFLQTLRTQQTNHFPQKTILLSPWLDVTMSNPNIEHYRGKDVLLHVEGLQACGKLYAGEENLKDPMVSPIYGNLNNLSNIKVFVSDHELFYPDCKLLAEKARTAPGTTVKLCVKHKMVHDWVILPIREQDNTISEIAAFLHGQE